MNRWLLALLLSTVSVSAHATRLGWRPGKNRPGPRLVVQARQRAHLRVKRPSPSGPAARRVTPEWHAPSGGEPAG
jgi:hypothetical protein